MRITRANVERYALSKGLEPVQEDGIPDGFVWKEPDITIGGKEHKGRIIKFKPLTDWDDKEAIIYG
jgi:hypothetical protein